MENTAIENKPIQGVTAKSLVWFFGGIITVVISVIVAFNIVKQEVAANGTKILHLEGQVIKLTEDNKTQDAKTETNNLKIQSLELQNVRLEEQLKRR